MNHYNRSNQLSYISLMATTRLRAGVFDTRSGPWVAGNQVDVIERCVDRYMAKLEREDWLKDGAEVTVLTAAGKPVIQSAMAWIDDGLFGEQQLAIEGYLRAEAGAEYAEYREFRCERQTGIPGGGPASSIAFLVPLRGRDEMIASLRDALAVDWWQKPSQISK